MKSRSKYILLFSGIIAILLILLIIAFYSGILPNATTTEVQSTVSPSTPSQSSTAYIWLSVTIFLLSATTTISILISFYLYKWRKKILQNEKILVPEEWGKYLESVGKKVTQSNENQTITLQSVIHASQDNSEKIQNMIETYMSLQKTLDEKDVEIRRLKKGYDTAITKKFLYRFIRIDQTINEFIEDKEFGPEQTDLLRRLFEDALEECGVEIFKPAIGEDIRKAEGIADNPKKITTTVADDDYKITEVISSGYRVMAGDQFDYIVPAKVKIFTYQKEEVN